MKIQNVYDIDDDGDVVGSSYNDNIYSDSYDNNSIGSSDDCYGNCDIDNDYDIVRW